MEAAFEKKIKGAFKRKVRHLKKKHNLYHFLKLPTLTTNRLEDKSKGRLGFLITTTQP